MHPIRTSDMLREISLFRYLSREEIEDLSWFASQRTYRKKTVVYEEYTPKKAVYFIHSGLIRTFRTNERGQEEILAFLKKGDLFPRAGLFDALPHLDSAETIVQSLLLELPIKPLEQYLCNHPQTAIKLLRAMEDERVQLQDRIQEMAMTDVDKRGQMFLLKLAEHYGQRVNGELRIGIPMTSQHFAETIGTNREAGTRLLNRLRDEGIADMSRSGFVIYDVDALRHWKET